MHSGQTEECQESAGVGGQRRRRRRRKRTSRMKGQSAVKATLRMTAAK